MGLKAGTVMGGGSGGQRKLPTVGEHKGVLISIIYMGTQPYKYAGEEKTRKRVRLTWELPEARAVFNEEKGEQPFVVSKEYTFSFSDKANIRADLKAWRNAEFTPEELKVFDIDSMLGEPCWVSVSNYEGSDGNKYAGVESLSKYRMGKIEPEGEVFAFWLHEGLDEERFNSFPEWMQEKIKRAPEYASAVRLNEIEKGEKQAF